MSFDLVLISLAIVTGGALLVALFMFGQATVDTIVAVFRLGAQGVSTVIRLVVNSILALSWYAIGALLVVVAGGAWMVYIYWLKPGNINALLHRVPVCSELLDRKGELLEYLCPFNGYRLWRPIQAIDSKLQNLVVMLEDDKFYEHGGLDVDEILNSIEEDLDKKKLHRGASTITQQLAKNIFLTKEKSFVRKALEVPLAFRLEKEFDKERLLELYLNTIEWGPGVFGVEAASRLYFDHEAATLKEEEAWLLALMIPNPIALNLWLAPKSKASILKRAKRLSTRLFLEKRMSKEEAVNALEKFNSFVEKWAASKPVYSRTGRHYPVRWAVHRSFTLGEIVSVRRKTSEYFGNFVRKLQVDSYLDGRIQLGLESILDPDLHAVDNGFVVALVERGQARALAPVAGDKAIPEKIRRYAAEKHLEMQLHPARKIPASLLWP